MAFSSAFSPETVITCPEILLMDSVFTLEQLGNICTATGRKVFSEMYKEAEGVWITD